LIWLVVKVELKKWQAGQLSLVEKPCSVWKKLMKSVKDKNTDKNTRFKNFWYFLMVTTTPLILLGKK